MPTVVRVLSLDVDGVLLDSKHAKRDAWRGVFAGRSRDEDAVLQRKVDAKVGDRYEILRQTLVEIGVDNAAIPDLVRSYAQRYDNLVREEISRKGTFPGVLETLRMLRDRGILLYANSQTPDDSLAKTLAEFRIDRILKCSLGSSRSKVENLKRISDMTQEPFANIVMVGDEDKDLAAANEVGCRFIGIADEVNGWSVQGQGGFPVLASFPDILGILEIQNILR